MRKTNTEVCPLSRRVMLQLVSLPLQQSIRFFGYPIPASLSARLTACFPRRERYGLTTFRLITTNDLGSAFFSGSSTSSPETIGVSGLGYSPFWSQPSQHLWVPVHHEVYRQFTFINHIVLFWRNHPPRCWQKFRFCPKGFTPRRYQQRILW